MIEVLGRLAVLAMTAQPLVHENVVKRLRMRDRHMVVCRFDWPNIWLDVEVLPG